MPAFIVLAALLSVVAAALVVWPLISPRENTRPSHRRVNLEILRDERAAIEADVAAGVLTEAQRDEALADLATRAKEELAQPDTGVNTAVPRMNRAAVATAIMLPLAAGLAYWQFGTPQALGYKPDQTPVAHVASPEEKLGDKQIVAMVESLKTKMQTNPDDPQGWQLLARSMAALGRYDESADAFSRLVKLQTPDAQVLADYADVLAMTQGRNLAGKPLELVQQALKLDPANRKALALAGTATMNSGQFQAAFDYWQRLRNTLPPGDEDAKAVDQVLSEIRDRAKAAGVALTAAATSTPPAAASTLAKTPAPPNAAAGGLSGVVTIAADLKAKLAPTDVLFILARSADGPDAPRMPLAVARLPVSAIGQPFKLDDSMSMSPQATLSSAKLVKVEARVSKAGTAQRQPGDLIGESAPLAPSSTGVTITIDRVVP